MKKRIGVILLVLATVAYLAAYGYFYSIQDERFKSKRLPPEYTFSFKEKFEEFYFPARDKGLLNALLFKADSSRGVVCYWKGNGGTLQQWGQISPQFLQLGYDLMIIDYREHGKSKGSIFLQNFYSDAQQIYDFLKDRYPENKIIVMGYSLGTNMASYLAANNRPSMTILADPRDRFRDKYLEAFFLPLPSVTRFPFCTEDDITKTRTPVVIITGTRSDLYPAALKLRKLLKEKDTFIEIPGADHTSLLSRPEFGKILIGLLTRKI